MTFLKSGSEGDELAMVFLFWAVVGIWEGVAIEDTGIL